MGLLSSSSPRSTDEHVHSNITPVETPESKAYKEIRSIHKLLTDQVDPKVDLDLYLSELQAKLQKKTRPALDFVIWDLKSSGTLGESPSTLKPGQRLSKAECASLLRQWVSISDVSLWSY